MALKHQGMRAREERRGALADVAWVLVVAALAYCGWKFVPPLKQRWTVDRVTDAYMDGLARTHREIEVAEGLYSALEQAGIDLDTVEVSVEVDEVKGRLTSSPLLNAAEVVVEFSPAVHHPIVKKVTTLKFTIKKRKTFSAEF